VNELISLADIQSARERIRGRVARTPLVSSATLSARLGAQVFLKLELFQKTGSFKVRGAFNKALSIPAEQRGRGLAAVRPRPWLTWRRSSAYRA